MFHLSVLFIFYSLNSNLLLHGELFISLFTQMVGQPKVWIHAYNGRPRLSLSGGRSVSSCTSVILFYRHYIPFFDSTFPDWYPPIIAQERMKIKNEKRLFFWQPPLLVIYLFSKRQSNYVESMCVKCIGFSRPMRIIWKIFRIETLRKYFQNDTIVISEHAKNRCRECNIKQKDIKCCVMSGEIVEQYPDDFPFPSYLIFGYASDKMYKL